MSMKSFYKGFLEKARMLTQMMKATITFDLDQLLERYSINGWPPLASHLGFCILGVIIMSFGTRVPRRLPEISQDHLLLPVGLFGEKSRFKAGDRVFLYQKEGKRIQCLVAEKSWRLVTLFPQPLVMLPKKINHNEALWDAEYEVAALHNRKKKVGPCRDRSPVVRFGSL